MAEQQRRRSGVVTLGITALLAAGLTACGSSEPEAVDDPDYGAVCVDQQTQQRLDDDRCDDDDYVGSPGLGLVGWYFIARGLTAPPLGARVGGGSYTVPAGGRVLRGGLPASGGTVARGGFGSSAKVGTSGSGTRLGSAGGSAGGSGGSRSGG